jgi:hypothetical protein
MKWERTSYTFPNDDDYIIDGKIRLTSENPNTWAEGITEWAPWTNTVIS